MDQNCISFVKGVEKDGAQPPRGFPYRFAVLTWFSCGPDSAAPWPLLRFATSRITKLVDADAVVGEMWKRRSWPGAFTQAKKIREAPLLEWLMKSDDKLYEEADFPSKLRFERRGEVVLWMESEMWNQVGGPLPYHDSVTLSFFSKCDLAKELEELFRAEATRVGVRIEEAV
jgi:hypothetical protein